MTSKKFLFFNLLLIGAGLLYFVAVNFRRDKTKLLKVDKETKERIVALEQIVRTDPSDGPSAVALAKLYQLAGETKWSLETLQKAEQTTAMSPSWYVSLGLAYLGLGRNDDGLRVLKLGTAYCHDHGTAEGCTSSTQFKLRTFSELATRFIDGKVNAATEPAKAEAILEALLKPANPVLVQGETKR